MVKNFTKKVENFICAVCNKEVYGNGFTNHCPNCLASLHVDIQPGDRACSCHGIMHAVGFEMRNGKEWILHRCEKCGFERRNQVSPNDSRSAIRTLAATPFKGIR